MRSLVMLLVVASLLGGCASDEYLLGGDLYQHSCAICHGVGGEGGIGTAIGTGSNTALNLTDEQIAGVITVGPGNMPGFSRLSDEQVMSLVIFVRSLAGDQ